MTSRPIAIDRQAFREILPVPEQQNADLDGEEFVRIALDGWNHREPLPQPLFIEVELVPLTDQQISALARKRGVVSPETLLAAIEAKNALDFARRPQDLIELCDDWRDHGRIRSHREQLETHVLAQLAARQERKELVGLSIEQARRGAQRLALATMLSGRLTIRYSAGADSESTESAPLDPRKLLQEWNEIEIATLLQRPLFGEGGYGRVRFHHRSVMEYLAACQIDELVETGTISFSAAKRMIFGLSDLNEIVLRPSMRPVAGWLSLLRQDVFDHVLEVEPDTLMRHGDPESLTVIQRDAVLRGFIDRYGNGQWRGITVPEIQVTRFAHHDLSNVILNAWDMGIENPEVRELLLRIISSGRIRGCADLAAEVAYESAYSDRERFEALVALAYLSDQRVSAIIDAIVTLAPGWTQRVARWTASFLYPAFVTDGQLLELLPRVRLEAGSGGDYAYCIARNIEGSNLSVKRLESLLPTVRALTQNNVEVRHDQLADRPGRLELSLVLRTICISLLKKHSMHQDLIPACVLAFRASENVTGLHKGNNELKDLLDALPAETRKLIFEADEALLDAFQFDRIVRYRYMRILHQGAINYTLEKDWKWILELVADPTTTDTSRSGLVFSACHLAAGAKDKVRKFAQLRLAVADSDTLTSQFNDDSKAYKQSKAVLNILKNHKRQNAAQQQERERRRELTLSFWHELIERPDLALGPNRRDTTLWNLWTVIQNSPGRDEGRWDRSFLERHFGRSAVNDVRQALMEYWRTMKPTVPSERRSDKKNNYLVIWTIGLMAIYAEAEDADWAAKLSKADAELAVRYALLNLNGLPIWLQAVAAFHSEQVERIIGNELIEELNVTPGTERWHSMLLQSLRNSPREIAQLFVPKILDWLNGPGIALMQMAHCESVECKLDQVLGVLIAQGDTSTYSTLERLAVAQLERAGDGPFLFFWLPLLKSLNPPRGISYLLEVIDRQPVEKFGVAVRLLGRLFSRYRRSDFPNWRVSLSADLLLRLTIATHYHVRFEDDLVHHSVYTPGIRDFAQNGRGYVFEAFMQLNGAEAFNAKQKLASHPLFSDLRDRIVALSKERIALELDSSAADMSDLVALFKGREISPKTGSGMAQLLIDRMDDLQELMRRDTGPREAWAAVGDENKLRPAIARELENAARGAYTVDQESVTVDGKEIDISLRALSGYKATIELKVGEKARSAKDLRDTIQLQLIDKYMAHTLARTGCLLVTVADIKRRWRHPDTKVLLNKDQLQEYLDAAAYEAQLRLGGESRVIARVLDLTPRLLTEADAKSKGKAK